MASDDSFFLQVLQNHLDPAILLDRVSFVSGGCINHTLRLDTSQGPYFIKWKTGDADLFEKEAKGLRLLSLHSKLRVPKVYGMGNQAGRSYLLMEFCERQPPVKDFWEDFGHKLARQHRVTQKAFGLEHDNHIGRLEQCNKPNTRWTDFFIEQRLQVQLNMALQAGRASTHDQKAFDVLYKRLTDFFPVSAPALLHGDLWSGNFLAGPEGRACIFDPAVYYGHHEMEIAYTQLFGGFDTDFYRAYEEICPLAPGFEQRVDIYNLYPLLVHVNLFGGSYLISVRNILERFQ
jgi:fructosamine-3-kinase